MNTSLAEVENTDIIRSTPLTNRAKINALEAEIIANGVPVEFETNHYFAHGTYTREVKVPRGTVITGKIHRYSCINIISKGKIRVLSDEGEYDIEAPYTFVSGPDVKKAGLVLEDVVWINVHPWNGEQNLELIEKELIIPSVESITGGNICLG